jgi:hypothetical protein
MKPPHFCLELVNCNAGPAQTALAQKFKHNTAPQRCLTIAIIVVMLRWYLCRGDLLPEPAVATWPGSWQVSTSFYSVLRFLD